MKPHLHPDPQGRARPGSRRALRYRPGLLLLCAALLLGSTACRSLSYAPQLSVGPSPETLPLRVQLRELVDASPSADREQSWAGTAATAIGTLQGELAPSVSEAIEENFARDGVVVSIGDQMEDPDLILTGTIHRFYGKASHNLFGWMALLLPSGIGSAATMLGLPIFTSRGEVDLELRFEAPDGAPLAAYRACEGFDAWESIYAAPLTRIGADVNRAFSTAIGSIRRQMLADPDPLLSAALAGADFARPRPGAALRSPEAPASPDAEAGPWIVELPEGPRAVGATALMGVATDGGALASPLTGGAP